MCNSDHGRISELLLDELLYLLLGNYVDISGGLIEDYDSVLPQDCSANAD